MSLRQRDEARFFQVATCVRRTGCVPERLSRDGLDGRESIFHSVIELVDEQRAARLSSLTLVYVLGDTYSIKDFPVRLRTAALDTAVHTARPSFLSTRFSTV